LKKGVYNKPMKREYNGKIARYNNKGQEGKAMARALTCRCGSAVLAPNPDGLCPRCLKKKEAQDVVDQTG
jgi:hypothetical protein